jgi:hypothetical protein
MTIFSRHRDVFRAIATSVFLIAITAIAGSLSAQCGLAVAESAVDEAATGAYTLRATMNAPGADGISYRYQGPNGFFTYYGQHCDDPANCSVPLWLGCSEIEKGDFGTWTINVTGHCDAGYQYVGPINLNIQVPKPTGSLTPFWDQDGIFRITIKYNFPLGIDGGNAWICVPTQTGQCNGPINGTAKYALHGSGEWTWRPTVGGNVALYLQGCYTGDANGTVITQAVTVQPDKTKSTSGSVTFDFPSTDPNAKILISKRSTDAFASQWQLPTTASGSLVSVTGTLRDTTTQQPKAGTVYLQLVDPPDTAPYAAGDAHVSDNVGTATFVGASGTGFAAAADGNGHFAAAVLMTGHTAGDNWQITGSADAKMTCANPNPCSKTGVFTLWKRVYVEEEHMFRAGSFIRYAALSGTDLVPVSDPMPFQGLTADSSVLEFVHADTGGGEGYYSEFATFHALEQDGSGHWSVRINSGLQHDFGPATPPTSPLQVLQQDGVGVVDAGTFDPANAYVAPLFAEMFTELTPLPPLAVAEVPFVAELTPAANLFFSSRWLQHATNVNATVRHPQDNVFHRITVRQTVLVSDQQSGKYGAELGVTTVSGGVNFSLLCMGRIEDLVAGNVHDLNGNLVGQEYVGLAPAVAEGETTAHETMHFWVHAGGVDGNGHCLAERWQHDGLNCLLHRPYAGPGLADGLVELHYENHGGDSEYMTVRRAADPVPQQ